MATIPDAWTSGSAEAQVNAVDAIDCLTERKNYLVGRIALKTERGWEKEWDQREHDSLEMAIQALEEWKKFERLGVTVEF